MASKKSVIVTGASQGIGAAVVQAFLDRGYNVVATSRSVSNAGFTPSPHLALVDGDIGQAATAEKVAQTAIGKFGSINHVVNNAGIFAAKPFTDYTADEFRHLGIKIGDAGEIAARTVKACHQTKLNRV
jgi:NAD(P)-dependent dehydrogenase (short-subunit alcohol dehydrogenase family)